MTSSYLDDTAAVVVHHRNYAVIGTTVGELVRQGIAPSRIVVVDNSEEPSTEADLRDAFDPGVTVVFVENLGYGAAVNRGLEVLSEISSLVAQFVLVATHEVAPRPGAVRALRDALLHADDAAGAGPTLVTGDGEEYVWSQGGRLTRTLALPRHVGHKARLGAPGAANSDTSAPVRRQWLDGACVLYRTAALGTAPFDETFFMYMEETELHLRLGRQGQLLLWVPNAVVWQSSSGVPSYYLTRNLRLLYRRTGRRKLGVIAVRAAAARRVLSGVRRGHNELPALARGLLAPLPGPPRWAPRQMRVINPLGVALRHYESELGAVLAAGGVSATVDAFPEPSASGSGRLAWLLAYGRAIRTASLSSARARDSTLVVTWPVLGYLDIVLVSLLYRGRGYVIMHDPVPLVRARGYGRTAVALARLFRGNSHVIVHSEAALRAVARRWPASATTLLPHPILPVVREAPRVAGSAWSAASRPTVRVLGQFKNDRNLEVLRALARENREKWSLEVFGRGWPPVEGWDVTDRFLTEGELATAIEESDVVVIPYARFFQSGIAIRAFEQGVPCVGPADSSLTDLFGAESPLLVAAAHDITAPWVSATEWAIEFGRGEVARRQAMVWTSTADAWRTWVGTTSREPQR